MIGRINVVASTIQEARESFYRDACRFSPLGVVIIEEHAVARTAETTQMRGGGSSIAVIWDVEFTFRYPKENP